MNSTLANIALSAAILLLLSAVAAAASPGLLPAEDLRTAQQLEPAESTDAEVQQVVYASEAAADEVPIEFVGNYPSTPYPGMAYNGGVGFPPAPPAFNDSCQEPATGTYYVELQMMYLRAHMLQSAIGKLSEQYEFSPRVVMGYEAPSGAGGRLRYWNYSETTPNLSDPNDRLRMVFDVFDLEGTYRFGAPNMELTVAGGFRWATIDVGVDGEFVGTEMPGATFAADLRSSFCHGCTSEWAAVAGARWTMLGGDWQGSNAGLIAPNRDDNIVTHEFYGGVEYAHHLDGFDLFARIVFEVQNWHSDTLSQSGGTDSIGFVGPGLQLGAGF